MTEPHGVPLTPDPDSTSRRSRKTLFVSITAVVVILLAVALSTVLVLNHRADVAAAERQQAIERQEQKAAAAQAAAEAEAERVAAEEAAAELKEARDVYESCRSQLGPFLNALTTVDARLDVGLSQSDLSSLVGRASVAYNRIDIDELGTGRCLRAGGGLETAFNQYVSTVSTWNDCIYELYCDVDDDVLPGMQLKWLKASNQLDRSEDMVESLDPDGSDYRADGDDSQV